jgi:hypothetical protein
MNLLKNIIIAIVIVGIFSCGEDSPKSVEKSVYADLDDLIESSKTLDNLEEISRIEEELNLLMEQYEDSSFNKFDNKSRKIIDAIATAKDLSYFTLVEKNGAYAEKGSKYVETFYGLSKDSVKIHFDADKKIKRLIVVEEQSGRQLKNLSKSTFDYVFDVHFDNPFSVIIEFYEESYFNLSIKRKPLSLENKFAICEIITDSVIVDKKTKTSLEGSRMKYEKVFNEPKKFVVSKSFSLSGESKVYAAIELPENTREFIYTLRISGETDKLSEDGTLFNQVDRSYKKVKVLGIPLWESEGNSTSITREILNSLFKPQIDDYTLNVFFFDDDKEIKKFVNYSGSDYVHAFAYDINNSAISTESRVGLIKKPKSGYSYIGLQTTSSFSDTYAWLDAIALSETMYYYELKKKLIRK